MLSDLRFEKHNVNIVFVAGADGVEFRTIRRIMRCIGAIPSMTGMTLLADLLGLLKRCSMCVGQ